MAHQHALARSRWTVIGTRYGMWNTQLMMNDNQGRMSIRLLFFWLRIAYKIDVPLGRRRRRLKYFLIFLMLSSVIDRYAVVTGLFLYFSGHVFYTNGFSLFFFIYFISPDLTELKLKKKKRKGKKLWETNTYRVQRSGKTVVDRTGRTFPASGSLLGRSVGSRRVDAQDTGRWIALPFANALILIVVETIRNFSVLILIDDRLLSARRHALLFLRFWNSNRGYRQPPEKRQQVVDF